jgi:hypothetical protein
MSNEAEVPSFPPLSSCLLIDSRMSSRLELKSYVQSTHLFEQIAEPESLDLGLKLINEIEVDICIFGQSLRPKNIEGFFSDLKKKNHNQGCAFVSIQRENEQFKIEGIHEILFLPCSRKDFNTGIIKALRNANSGVLPLSKKINPITGEPISLAAAIEKIQTISEGQTVPISKISELSKILACIEPGNLLFKPNGDPTAKTTEVIKEIIMKVLPDEKDNLELIRFQQALEKFLYKWIEIASNSGRQVANLRLKQDILEYFAN